MNGFLAWAEGSALGHAMRESGVWTYGVVNLVHILGVAALFGSILILDLRLIGLWRRVPLEFISQPTVRIGGLGVLLAAVSGMGLLATKATEYAGNPFFSAKFVAIGVGLINVAFLARVPAWRDHRHRAISARDEGRLARFGAVSLLSWLAAIVCGRMTGYW